MCSRFVALWLVWVRLTLGEDDHRVHLRHHTLHLADGRNIDEYLGFDELLLETALNERMVYSPAIHRALNEVMERHHSKHNHSRVPWLVTLQGPIHESQKLELRAHLANEGATVGSYVPDNTFLVFGPPGEEFRGFVLGFPSTVGATLVHHRFKAPAWLTDKHHPAHPASLNPNGHMDITVHVEAHLVDHYGGSHESVRMWLDGGVEGEERLSTTLEVSWAGHGDLLRAHVKNIPTRLLSSFVGRLTTHPMVLAVERKPKVSLQNKFAKYIIQTNDPRSTLVWDHNLKGEGEILAVADTGIDHDSCWFADRKHPVPFNKVNLDHRKIVYYNSSSLGDNHDEVGGHGSHVVGSLTGEASPLFADSERGAQFNGMAPKAKIAFFDYDKKHDFSVPDNLYRDYYEIAFQLPRQEHGVGARVMSNSWGTDPNGYDSMSIELDSFLFDNPTFLAVMAAGNYGRKHYTLSSPGNAKNCLTIGATGSSVEAFQHWGQGVGITLRKKGQTPTRSGLVSDLPGAFRRFVHNKHVEAKNVLVLKDDNKACNASEYQRHCHRERGCVVFTKCTSECDIKKRLDIAEKVHASFVIFYGECPQTLNAKGDKVRSVGAGVMRLGDFKKLDPKTGEVAQAPAVYHAQFMAETAVPAFSSKGPTSDGRIKPDVLTPGHFTESIHSDGVINGNTERCGDTQRMQGTSMATPIGAGGAALVRQYLREGYYPTGAKNDRDAISEPAAALIKAMIINGAEPMGPYRKYMIGKSLEFLNQVPDTIQGYGRMKLDTTLYFRDDAKAKAEAAPPIFVHHDDRGLRTAMTTRFCFSVHHKAPIFFKITLAWTDPIASKISGKQLVNNLDLIVSTTGDKRMYVGNQPRYTDQTAFLPALKHDDINNVEQVGFFIPAPSADHDGRTNITVQVHGRNVPQFPQKYAIAAGIRPVGVGVTVNSKGEPEMMPPSEVGLLFRDQHKHTLSLQEVSQLPNGECTHMSCPSDCSGHGECMADWRCACFEDYGGVDCSVTGELVDFNKTQDGSFHSSFTSSVPGWVYYRFKFGKNGILGFDKIDKSIQAVRVRFSDSSDASYVPPAHAEIYIRKGELPTNGNYASRGGYDSKNQDSKTPAVISNMREGTYWVGVHYRKCSSLSKCDIRLHMSVGSKAQFMIDTPDNPNQLVQGLTYSSVAVGALAILAVVVTLGVCICRRIRNSGGNDQYAVVQIDNLDSVQIEQHMGDDEEVDVVDQDQAIDIVGPSGEEIEATGRSEGKLHDEGDDDAHDLDDPSGGIATGDVDLSIRDDR